MFDVICADLISLPTAGTSDLIDDIVFGPQCRIPLIRRGPLPNPGFAKVERKYGEPVKSPIVRSRESKINKLVDGEPTLALSDKVKQEEVRRDQVNEPNAKRTRPEVVPLHGRELVLETDADRPMKLFKAASRGLPPTEILGKTARSPFKVSFRHILPLEQKWNNIV